MTDTLIQDLRYATIDGLAQLRANPDVYSTEIGWMLFFFFKGFVKH